MYWQIKIITTFHFYSMFQFPISSPMKLMVMLFLSSDPEIQKWKNSSPPKKMVLWYRIHRLPSKAILLVHEYEKQGKIKDEYRRVFDAVKKAKPGIDVILNTPLLNIILKSDLPIPRRVSEKVLWCHWWKLIKFPPLTDGPCNLPSNLHIKNLIFSF